MFTHYEMGTAPILATTVPPFVNGQMDAKGGAAQ